MTGRHIGKKTKGASASTDAPFCVPGCPVCPLSGGRLPDTLFPDGPKGPLSDFLTARLSGCQSAVTLRKGLLSGRSDAASPPAACRPGPPVDGHLPADGQFDDAVGALRPAAQHDRHPVRILPEGELLPVGEPHGAADANEAKDKAEKERIDKINAADSNIFTTEKQLKEYGDKLPADKKAAIESALGKLKEAHKNADVAAIDTAMAELNAAWQAASQDIYAQQQAQGAAGQQSQQQSQSNAGNSNGNSGQPEDVEFEEVK